MERLSLRNPLSVYWALPYTNLGGSYMGLERLASEGKGGRIYGIGRKSRLVNKSEPMNYKIKGWINEGKTSFVFAADERAICTSISVNLRGHHDLGKDKWSGRAKEQSLFKLILTSTIQR